MIAAAQMKQTTIKPPSYLSKESRDWFASVVDSFDLDQHHVRLRGLACESWDEKEAARAEVAKSGATFTDRYGQPREHPAVGTGRQARIQFARLVRDLGLDIDSPAESRPNRIGGQKW